MNEKPATMRAKLYRCLEIAMSHRDLGCHINTIIQNMAHCIRDEHWYNSTTDIWCDYFISKNGDKATLDGVYPLTVVADRYTGAYSGGKWTAWNLYPQDVPEGIFGDDCGCSDFWSWDSDEYCVGIGETPEEAIMDLKTKLGTERW